MGEGVPEWAQPMNLKLFRQFQAQVETCFNKRIIKINYDWNEGSADLPTISHKLFFNNLLVYWREAELDEKQAVIERFAVGMIDGHLIPRMKLVNDLDNLMIRVYDFEYYAVDCLVAQPVGQFLLPSLVIDGPLAIRTVMMNEVEESGISVSELFQIAKDNLLIKAKAEATRRSGPLGELTTVIAEAYGASYIMRLEKNCEASETYWVMTPNKHVLQVLRPIKRDEETLGKFLEIGERFQSDVLNDNIHPFVLEYKNGVFRDLCKIGDGRIEIA